MSFVLFCSLSAFAQEVPLVVEVAGGATSPDLAVTSAADRLELDWDVLVGAESYRYRHRRGNQAWSSSTHTQATAATIAGLSNGVTYTVAVDAKVNGSWDAVWTKATLATGAMMEDSEFPDDPEDPDPEDPADPEDPEVPHHPPHGTGDWVMAADETAVYTDTDSSTKIRKIRIAQIDSPAYGPSRIGWLVQCESVGFDQIDPIVNPGQAMSAHMHEFFGNPNVHPDLVTQDLFDTPQSDIACTDLNDKSAYWSPAVYQDGVRVQAEQFKAYYKSPKDVVNMPVGLRMVAGNAHADANQNRLVGGWYGAGQDADVNTEGANQMMNRPNGGKIALRINYPQCWDGVHLDSPDHQSHMSYKQGQNCPSSHPVRIPQLVTFTQYNVAGGSGFSLASGEWFTFHQDFWNGWSPDQMQRLVDTCINDEAMCRVSGSAWLKARGQRVIYVP